MLFGGMFARLNLLRWALRKLLLPIRLNDMVLDVGSGGNPYPQADVLLERYRNPAHRFGAKLAVDRPIVMGDACEMPFKDRVFDFVIAAHVLEHVREPERFLRELMRVGRAGYIETPNLLFERLVPYPVHLLEIMLLDGELVIHKKERQAPDDVLSGLRIVPRDPSWTRLFYGRPELFHVCYLWKDEIRFAILNPDTSTNWFPEPDDEEGVSCGADASNGRLRRLTKTGFRSYRRMFRRRRVDLQELLACPRCHGDLEFKPETYSCVECRFSYAGRGIPDFTRGMPL